MTEGTVLARYMTFYFEGTVVTCLVDASLEQSKEVFETTCKDSGAWAEPRPGTKSWSFSGTGNVAFDSALGLSQIQAWYNADTVVEGVFGTGVSGDSEYTGEGFFSSLNVNSAGNDAPVTFDFTFTGQGTLAYAS